MVSGAVNIGMAAVLAADLPDLDPSKLEASMARLASVLGEAGLDVSAGLRADQLRVPAVLTACNAILDLLELKIDESEPGKFSLTSREDVPMFDEPDEPLTDDKELDGALLARWLLLSHGCISVLSLTFEKVEGLVPSLLKTAFHEQSTLQCISLYGSLLEETVDDFTSSLSTLSSVRYFSTDWPVSDYAAKNIARMLTRSNPSVENVCLPCFGNEGFASAVEALSDCRNLRSLDFSHGSFGVASAELLATFLLGATHLGELVVAFSEDCSAEVVLYAMRTNISVKTLEVSGKGRTVEYVADVLTFNIALENLDISGCYVDTFGAHIIADALRRNMGLRKLEMKNNRIGDGGAIAIAEALRLNNHLQELNCGSSSVSYAVLKAFALTLAQNTSLTMVHLPEIKMNTKKESELRSMLKSSGACRRLSTTWNDIGLGQLAADIEGKALKVLHLAFDYETGLRGLGDVFDAVWHCAHVTHLTIEDPFLLPKSCIANLALALTFSKTLKTVELGPDSEYELYHFESVIESLKLNTSITRMNFGQFNVFEGFVDEFSEMLRVNGTLHWLHFNCAALSDEELGLIASGLSGNETLLELGYGIVVRSKPRLAINECLRRNQRTLNRAVEFVLGVGADQESRASFGKLCRKDSLVDMMKTVTGQSDTEVREAIEEAVASHLRVAASVGKRKRALSTESAPT